MIINHCQQHNRRENEKLLSKLLAVTKQFQSLAKLLSIKDHVNMFLLKMFMPGSWSWPSWSGRASHRSCPMLSPLPWTGSTSRPGQNQLEKLFCRRSISISSNMQKSESDLEIGGVENGCAGRVVNVAGRNQVSEISKRWLHDPEIQFVTPLSLIILTISMIFFMEILETWSYLMLPLVSPSTQLFMPFLASSGSPLKSTASIWKAMQN